MGLFYRKRIGIFNLSKRGVSASIGPKGAKVSTQGTGSISFKGLRFITKLFSLIALLAVAATVGVSSATASATHSCSSGWKHAVIAKKHVCLRRGQFCTKLFDRQYHKYGYHCHGRRLT